MATITSNATGGGNWSSAATWAGGATPADNDTVVVVAGDTVTLDVDMSSDVAWPNGIAGLTISSHATTPGMLRFKYDADGTYHLKVKTGATIQGTNAAAKGRLLANSDGVWGNTGPLAFGRKAIIDLQGTANISALYLDIALYCTQPTNNSMEIYGTAYVVTCEADDNKITFVSPSTTPPQAGTPVTLSGTLPPELTAGTTYYVRDVSGATCKLEPAIGGGAIDLTGDGSGTIYLHYGKWGPVAQSTAVNTTTGAITWDGVPPAAGTAVVVRSSDVLPTGLTANDMYYVRSVSGNTCKLALLNADEQIVIPFAVGTGNISMYCGGAATTTAVVNAATDLSGDAAWITTDGHNYAVLVDTFERGNDNQRLQINTIAPRYLILSSNVNSAQNPGARVWLTSRNVAIRSSATSDISIVNYGEGSHGGMFACSIRSTAGADTAYYGIGFSGGAGHTVSGTVAGCTYGFNGGEGHTVSGTVAGCYYGISSGAGHTVSGTVAGCTFGIIGGAGHTVSGTVTGCTYGIIGGAGHTVSGTVAGCTYGISSGAGHTVSGTVAGCYYGINGGAGQLQAAVFAGNDTDVNLGDAHRWIGWGVTLLSVIHCAAYKYASQTKAESRAALCVYDFGAVANYLEFWTLGGFCKTAAYAAGTHLAPPVASTYIHEMRFEDNHRVNWVEYTIYGKAGQAITVTLYGRLTGTAAWTTRPNIGIYDPTKGWQTGAEILNASAAMASNTDWQTLTATYTPTYDRELRIRVQGVGGNTSGTGTEKLYWFFNTNLGGAGGPVRIE